MKRIFHSFIFKFILMTICNYFTTIFSILLLLLKEETYIRNLLNSLPGLLHWLLRKELYFENLGEENRKNMTVIIFPS